MVYFTASIVSVSSNDTILVGDITVANCNIIHAPAKPIGQFQNDPIPVNEVKIIWWENINPYRLNNRLYGKLKGKALRNAQRIVNPNNSLSMSAR